MKKTSLFLSFFLLFVSCSHFNQKSLGKLEKQGTRKPASLTQAQLHVRGERYPALTHDIINNFSPENMRQVFKESKVKLSPETTHIIFFKITPMTKAPAYVLKNKKPNRGLAEARSFSFDQQDLVRRFTAAHAKFQAFNVESGFSGPEHPMDEWKWMYKRDPLEILKLDPERMKEVVEQSEDFVKEYGQKREVAIKELNANKARFDSFQFSPQQIKSFNHYASRGLQKYFEDPKKNVKNMSLDVLENYNQDLKELIEDVEPQGQLNRRWQKAHNAIKGLKLSPKEIEHLSDSKTYSALLKPLELPQTSLGAHTIKGMEDLENQLKKLKKVVESSEDFAEEIIQRKRLQSRLAKALEDVAIAKKQVNSNIKSMKQRSVDLPFIESQRNIIKDIDDGLKQNNTHILSQNSGKFYSLDLDEINRIVGKTEDIAKQSGQDSKISSDFKKRKALQVRFEKIQDDFNISKKGVFKKHPLIENPDNFLNMRASEIESLTEDFKKRATLQVNFKDIKDAFKRSHPDLQEQLKTKIGILENHPLVKKPDNFLNMQVSEIESLVNRADTSFREGLKESYQTATKGMNVLQAKFEDLISKGKQHGALNSSERAGSWSIRDREELRGRLDVKNYELSKNPDLFKTMPLSELKDLVSNFSETEIQKEFQSLQKYIDREVKDLRNGHRKPNINQIVEWVEEQGQKLDEEEVAKRTALAERFVNMQGSLKGTKIPSEYDGKIGDLTDHKLFKSPSLYMTMPFGELKKLVDKREQLARKILISNYQANLEKLKPHAKRLLAEFEAIEQRARKYGALNSYEHAGSWSISDQEDAKKLLNLDNSLSEEKLKTISLSKLGSEINRLNDESLMKNRVESFRDHIEYNIEAIRNGHRAPDKSQIEAWQKEQAQKNSTSSKASQVTDQSSPKPEASQVVDEKTSPKPEASQVVDEKTSPKPEASQVTDQSSPKPEPSQKPIVKSTAPTQTGFWKGLGKVSFWVGAGTLLATGVSCVLIKMDALSPPSAEDIYAEMILQARQALVRGEEFIPDPGVLDEAVYYCSSEDYPEIDVGHIMSEASKGLLNEVTNTVVGE